MVMVSPVDYQLYALLVVGGALVAGFVLGRRIGRNEERVRQTLRTLRKRRPLNVNVDYSFAVNALDNAGFAVTAKGKLH